MLRSFRWRLRIWHTLTLVVVVSAFASLLYWNVRSSRLGEVDSQLLGGRATCWRPPFEACRFTN